MSRHRVKSSTLGQRLKRATEFAFFVFIEEGVTIILKTKRNFTLLRTKYILSRFDLKQLDIAISYLLLS